jgi:F-type H+-transporting ATPase subunit alpha
MFMATLVEQLDQYLKETYDNVGVSKVGVIREVGDGVVSISGLPDAMMSEMLRFENGQYGLVLNLNKDNIGAVVLGDMQGISVGQQATSTGRLLEIGAGENYLGRVVDALGLPMDGKGTLTPEKQMPIEKIAPGVMARQGVDQPLQTGVKAIDALVPIGRGQRELIIGDRQTGKSTLALQAIINQKNSGVLCVYVAIGQKASFLAQTVALLEEEDALKNTVIVSADAQAAASMQYIAPYAGTAIAEFFLSQGKDVLIVYDDLTKHAWAYRQMSLLLRRPSGREAYPGDVFYLHSRLLERACRLNKEHGGGSITALPVIETQAGDISAYIPTNVISITDGQIFLDTDLFYSGVRPAINVGNSVSRVGSSAQTKAMKSVAGKLKIELSQFRELAAFSQFASDLDDVTKRALDRGARLSEILKQGVKDILSVGEQVLQIWAVAEGYTKDVPKEEIVNWGSELLEYARMHQGELLSELDKGGKPSEDMLAKMKTLVENYNVTRS